MNHFFSSKTILIIVIFICTYFTYNNGIPRIFLWDTFGQYIYLPMLFDQKTFIYSNLDYFEILNQKYDISSTLYQFVDLENGNKMSKYTVGLAVLMLPFYLIAEVWATISNHTTDGFTYPYQCMLAFGSSFYFIVGLFAFRKVLKYYFEENIVSILLILSLLGTNFFFIQFASLGSTHNLEFTLVSLMIITCIKFPEKMSLKNGIYLGLLLGLITLVRAPDLIFALLPIFWKINENDKFSDKFRLFTRTKRKVLIYILISFLLVLFIQLGIWKYVAGTWIMNSYANNPGEGFDWFHPYFLEVLFSFKKGWFIYTPIMIFSIIGFWSLWKKNINGKLFSVTFILFFYVVSSWTTWWYAASYSQRAMIDSLPILSISLGYFMKELKSLSTKIIGCSFLFLLLILNLFQTFQVTKGILHLHRMTKAYYFSTFGQISSPSYEQTKLLALDRDEIFISKKIDLEKFHKTMQKTIIFPQNTKVNDSIIYAPKVAFEHLILSEKSYFWLKVKWKYEGEKNQLEGKIFNMCAMYKNKAYGWEGFHVLDSNIQVNDSLKEIEFVYFTPHFRSKNDLIHFGLWNQFGEELNIKSVYFEIFEPYFDNE